MAKNPVEEFLSIEKTANSPGVFGRALRSIPGHMAQAGAGAVAMGTVGLVGAGIHAAVSNIVDAATKSHDFKQMLNVNEDLHEHYQQDPKRFSLMFSTLRSVNPQYSKDPLVAGAFMRRMIESPQGIGGIASEALKDRSNFPETTWGVAQDYAREGARAGLTESVKTKSPKDLLALERPRMDYQQRLRSEENALQNQFRAQEADRQHARAAQENKAQRAFQMALQRMPQVQTGSSRIREFDESGNPRGWKEERSKRTTTRG